MKNITLQDIADEMGLTKVSISKALRDHPDISEDTRVRVKKLAAEMGYRPNLLARSLTSSKSKSIGLIIPKIAHHFFAKVVESIYKTAFQNEYEVLIGVSHEDEELEKVHIETMLQMRVDGLLVSVSEQTTDASSFEVVKKMGIDLVFFDRGFADAGFSYIKAEDRNSARIGVEKLIANGFTKIAHLAGYDTVEIGKKRRLGFEDAMNAAGLKIEDGAIVEGGFSEDDGYQMFKKVVEHTGLPEALFVATFPMGLGALKAMKEMDIDPRTVEILSFGKSDYNDYLISPFLCIDQPTTSLGERAVRQLLDEMNNKDTPRPILEELASQIF